MRAQKRPDANERPGAREVADDRHDEVARVEIPRPPVDYFGGQELPATAPVSPAVINSAYVGNGWPRMNDRIE